MASGALFGNATARNQSKNLVEFRAGKMYMKGKMVHPDKRKGQVYVYQSDDSLMHFCWKDRTKGNVEDDFIIFPDDVEFKHVPQCTTGRVYLLKFKSTSRKMFFWMQEPKSDKDEDYMKKVNDFLNNPPTPGSSRGGGGSLPPDFPGGLGGDPDLQSMLGNMSQQQLMQLLGGMGMGGMGGISSALMGGRPASAQSDSAPQNRKRKQSFEQSANKKPSRVQSSPGPRSTAASSTPTTAARPVTAAALPSQTTTTTPTTATTTPAPTAAGGAATGGSRPTIQLSDLQNILSGLGPGQGGAEGVDLSTALTPELMLPILANADVQAALLPHLPEGGPSLPKTETELRATVSTPQFQQALQSFSAALASGQLGPLMSQFGLGEDVANAAAAGDVDAFVKAMQAKEAKDKEDSAKKE